VTEPRVERRRFIRAVVGSGMAAAIAWPHDVAATQAAAAAAGPSFYMWRQYSLRNGTQPRRLAEYLQSALIPALGRLGHAPVGAFEAVFGVATPTVFTIVQGRSLDALVGLDARLEQDEQYTRGAAAYADAPAGDPSYIRQETSLLAAFPKVPGIEVPAATAAKGPRLFELRTYESPSEKAHRAKVRMFDEMGEIEIFRRAGLTPVFFSRTIAGPRMPSLVYMLVHENMAGREKSWDAFRNAPEWKKLSATPGYTDAEIVSNITTVFLRPAAYSQI
jgi:hypothetical protein